MQFRNFTITKREIIFSVVILAVMLILGFVIHGSIDNSLMLKHQEYNTALRIDNDTNMFVYGMNTNVGNSYVYGELKAVDPVTYQEIGGEYSSVKKVKEKYTMHTRVVTYTVTVNGKPQTRTRTETYWTWDPVQTWRENCTKITFLDVEFDYGKIDFPEESYITTIKESSHIRYKYYGAPTTSIGTVYTDLRDGTMSDASMRHNTSIEDTHKQMTSKGALVVFWIFWVPLTCGTVFAFVYIDNRWLEDY